MFASTSANELDGETMDGQLNLWSEEHLVALARGLGAENVGELSVEESALLDRSPAFLVDPSELDHVAGQILRGSDPLGRMFSELRTPAERRPHGATYTPPAIVDAMIAWAVEQSAPARVIDPGAGSGRFAVAAGRAFPAAEIVAIEMDPTAALLTRGHLAAAGMSDRSQVLVSDYRDFTPEPIDGRTLYIGNPPYVRHHDVGSDWKRWLVETSRKLGLRASQLAGLHVHFFLQTALVGQVEDYGAFITAAEWLDVNYGSLVRELLLGPLGGQAVHVVEPTAQPFEDAQTTAAITCFRLGDIPRSVRLRRVEAVDDLGTLGGGTEVLRERLAEARRWSTLTRTGRRMPEGFIELGDLCRVHRGAVTGSNETFVVRGHQTDLPERFLYATVTKARELIAAATVLTGHGHLRRVVDLPADLAGLDASERKAVDRFLREAKQRGVHEGYVASHRKAWWSVGLRDAAPILATYMARRAPAFVRNVAGARHINIAHGIYPREPLSELALDRLAHSLREIATVGDGRTYAGGLTKFEPKEMERLLVPSPELLLA